MFCAYIYLVNLSIKILLVCDLSSDQTSGTSRQDLMESLNSPHSMIEVLPNTIFNIFIKYIHVKANIQTYDMHAITSEFSIIYL